MHLKYERESHNQMSSGREFHKIEAEYLKGRPPTVWSLKTLRTNVQSCNERSERFGVYILIWVLEIKRSEQWIILKVKSWILYCTQYSMGSQCRFFKMGVVCSNFLVLVMTRAAAFWTRWSLLREAIGSPSYMHRD